MNSRLTTIFFPEWKFGLAKLIRNMQRTNVAPSPLNLFTTWLVLLRKRFLEKKHEKMRAQLKFRRAMRDDIMQKAPGMRFVYSYSILTNIDVHLNKN